MLQRFSFNFFQKKQKNLNAIQSFRLIFLLFFFTYQFLFPSKVWSQDLDDSQTDPDSILRQPASEQEITSEKEANSERGPASEREPDAEKSDRQKTKKLGPLSSLSQNGSADAIYYKNSPEEDDIKLRARKRLYPGGKDEENLKVQSQLGTPVRKMSPTVEAPPEPAAQDEF